MRFLIGLFGFVSVTQRLDAAEDPYVPIVLGDGAISPRGCPLMRVFEGKGAGVYHYQYTYDVWRNSEGFINMHTNDYFKVGPADDYNENNNTFNSFWNYGPEIAECVFSRNYCYQVELFTNSICGSGLWKKISNVKWTMDSNPDYFLKVGEDFDNNGDRNWECYNASGLQDSVRDVSKYFIATCINDILPEGVKYGYNHYLGIKEEYLPVHEKIYLVGEGSPDSMVYHEGSFFRMFQITSPETWHDIMVYPRYGQYYRDSVAVVTAYGSENAAFTMITDLRHSFRLQRPIHCKWPEGRKINILQMQVGTHVFGDEKVIAQRGFMMEHHKEKDITFPERFNGSALPVIIGQIYDPSAGKWVITPPAAVHRIKSITQTGFSVFMEGYFSGSTTAISAEFGYVAMYTQDGVYHGNLWGNRIFVAAEAVQFSNTFKFTTHNYAKGEEVLLFCDISSYSDGEIVATADILYHPFGAPEFTLTILDYCSTETRKVQNRVSVATLGFVSKPKDLVREPVPGRGLEGCPIVFGGGECPEILFYATKKFTEYISHTGFTIKFDGDKAFCYNEAHVNIGAASLACVPSGTACIDLTVLNGECRGIVDWSGGGTWKNDANYRIEYLGMYNDGYMRLGCYDASGNLVDSNVRYVCDNNFLDSGITYGLNKMGDDYVYIVGDYMMSVGWAYRLFTVTMPADGSPVWVYPMANAWAAESNHSIKAQVHTNNKYPIAYVSEVDSVSNLGFKLEVVYGDCGHYGGEVVNIMQVRTGVYKHGTEELAAGSMNFTDKCDKCKYWGAEGQKGTWFDWTPKLFVQLQEVYTGPSHHFIFAEYKAADKKKFYVYVDGYGKESSWHVKVGWIGMMMDIRESMARTMLSALDYSSKSVYSRTNIAVRSYPDTRRPYTKRPFIFAEKFIQHLELHYPIVIPTSDSTEFVTVIGNYQCDPAIKEQVKDVGYDVTSIGETVEPVRPRLVNFGENTRGCPLMRGFGVCNKLFYPDLDVMNTPDNKHILFKRSDGLWECCERGDTTPPACKSGGDAMEGERIADCLTSETFCDYIDVYVETYGGPYPTKVGASTYQRDDGILLTLKKGDGGEMTAAILDSPGVELATVNASQMNCGRNNPIDTKYGRASYGDNKWAEFENYYLVKDQYVEGPGSSHSLHSATDEVPKMVWYKYFQIEITEADVLSPLYVHVPGAHFNETVAIAQAYNNSGVPMGIVFSKVSSNGFRIQARLPTCETSFASERINVLLAAAGVHTTYDGVANFGAHISAPLIGKKGATFDYNYYDRNPPTILADIQETTVSHFVSTRVSYDGSWDGGVMTVGLEVEKVHTIPDDAKTTVGVVVVSTVRSYSVEAQTGRDQVYAFNTNGDKAWDITDAARTFKINLMTFQSAPLIFLELITVNGPDPCELRLDGVNATNWSMQIVEDSCTDTHHNEEEWCVLMLGTSARETDPDESGLVVP